MTGLDPLKRQWKNLTLHCNKRPATSVANLVIFYLSKITQEFFIQFFSTLCMRIND